MINCAANADETVVGCDRPLPTAFVDMRVHQLETACAELGTRLAALEGLIVSLQQRVRELEAGTLETNLTRSAGLRPATIVHPALRR